jgi:hypothetical protein
VGATPFLLGQVEAVVRHPANTLVHLNVPPAWTPLFIPGVVGAAGGPITLRVEVVLLEGTAAASLRATGTGAVLASEE